MTEPGNASLDARKHQARTAAKMTRAEAAADDPVATGYALCERVMGALSFPAACVVSTYWPIGSEIDPRPLMHRLRDDGYAIALPVITEDGAPLIFRAWQPGDSLEPAGFDTRVPLENQPELTPQVLIVPMLAFDRSGHRLGYGGGFYDRTLVKLRESGPGDSGAGSVLAVGVAYAAQEVAEVPHDGSDQAVDWIVTEDEALEIRTGSS